MTGMPFSGFSSLILSPLENGRAKAVSLAADSRARSVEPLAGETRFVAEDTHAAQAEGSYLFLKSALTFISGLACRPFLFFLHALDPR